MVRQVGNSDMLGCMSGDFFSLASIQGSPVRLRFPFTDWLLPATRWYVYCWTGVKDVLTFRIFFQFLLRLLYKLWWNVFIACSHLCNGYTAAKERKKEPRRSKAVDTLSTRLCEMGINNNNKKKETVAAAVTAFLLLRWWLLLRILQSPKGKTRKTRMKMRNVRLERRCKVWDDRCSSRMRWEGGDGANYLWRWPPEGLFG